MRFIPLHNLPGSLPLMPLITQKGDIAGEQRPRPLDMAHHRRMNNVEHPLFFCLSFVSDHVLNSRVSSFS